MPIKITLIVLFLLALPAYPQDDPPGTRNAATEAYTPGAAPVYELTVYLIPSAVKYDWTSPRSLYRSYFRNYVRNILKSDSYYLGHAFLEFGSSLDSEKVLTGIRSTNREQQKEMVLKEDYGLAILGAPMEGKLQDRNELENQILKYSRKGKLAFIRLIVSDQAVSKMAAFYQSFKMRLDSVGYSSCYGGAFWPRYYAEGSGCSAFVVSFMDVAGLLRQEFDLWEVEVNIPMHLIGGPYNPDHEVEMKDIKKCMNWYPESGQAQVDYIPFRIYDPTLIFEWLQGQYESPGTLEGMTVRPVTLNRSKGIEIDARNVPVPDGNLFMRRSEPSLFIDYYHSGLNRGK